MHRAHSLTTLACVLSLLAGAAVAQQPAAQNPPPSGNQPAVVHRGGLQKTHDGWRASQILGATVYSDTNQGIGDINDLIVDPQGKVTEAVISVGGFLGIGSKLVGVPYDQLKFQERNTSQGAATTGTVATPAATTPTPATGTAAGGNATTGAAPATQATMGGTAANPGAGAAPAAGQPVQVVQTQIVLPGATKDSLTKMPDFQF